MLECSESGTLGVSALILGEGDEWYKVAQKAVTAERDNIGLVLLPFGEREDTLWPRVVVHLEPLLRIRMIYFCSELVGGGHRARLDDHHHSLPTVLATLLTVHGGTGASAHKGQKSMTGGAGVLSSQENQGAVGNRGGTLPRHEIIGDTEKIQNSDQKELTKGRTTIHLLAV